MDSFSDFLLLLPWFLATEAIGLLIGWWLWGSSKKRLKVLRGEHRELQVQYEGEKAIWEETHQVQRRDTASAVVEIKQLQQLAKEHQDSQLLVPAQDAASDEELEQELERLRTVESERDQLKRKMAMFTAFGSMEDDLKAKIEALKEENTTLFRLLEEFEAERMARLEPSSGS